MVTVPKFNLNSWRNTAEPKPYEPGKGSKIYDLHTTASSPRTGPWTSELASIELQRNQDLSYNYQR